MSWRPASRNGSRGGVGGGVGGGGRGGCCSGRQPPRPTPRSDRCSCLVKDTYSRVPRAIDRELIGKLDQLYARLRNSNSESMLKRYLTPVAFDILKMKRTSYGSSLLDVIRSGAEYPDSSIGVFAPDPEAYLTYRPLFNAIIDEIHGFDRLDTQPQSLWGNPYRLTNLDPTGNYVISTRVRVCRNLAKFPFTPCMSRDMYIKAEKIVVAALGKLEGEYKGEYLPLEEMDSDTQWDLREGNFLFPRCHKFLGAGNIGRFWPSGRGVYLNEDVNFMVWVGKEDHMRIISMQPGGNLHETYWRLGKGAHMLEHELDYAHDERLGYLTTCPSNLGTTLRASVLVRLPQLHEEGLVEEMAEKEGLEVRGTRGHYYPVEDGIYAIGNRKRMGLTEFELIRQFHDAFLRLMWQEEKRAISLKQELEEQVEKKLDKKLDKMFGKEEKKKEATSKAKGGKTETDEEERSGTGDLSEEAESLASEDKTGGGEGDAAEDLKDDDMPAIKEEEEEEDERGSGGGGGEAAEDDIAEGEGPEVSESNEGEASLKEEDNAEAGEEEENAESGEDEDNAESGEDEDNAESGEDEDNAESGEEEENAEAGEEEENAEAGEEEENAEAGEDEEGA